MVKFLSKSSANLFLQCPYKWKKSYVDKIRQKPFPQMMRGIEIHKKVEHFYDDFKPTKTAKPDKDLKNLLNFELNRVKEMIKVGKLDKKYFFPLFQELKLSNEEMGVRGICDAVFINPKDDCLIVIDWKTGKYYPDKFDEYRFELAVYAELLRLSGKTDEKPKYWGIYFLDQDKLFFEEINDEYIKKMYETIKHVKDEIAAENFEPKKNKYCYFCQFKGECPLMRWGS